jgi:hypothetical protein
MVRITPCPSVLLEARESAEEGSIVCYSDGLSVLKPKHGWGVFARDCSEILGGQWHPKPRGCTWQMGNKSHWFCAPSEVTTILEARLACSQLGLECGWSVGSAARAMLLSVGTPQKWVEQGDAFLGESCFGYHECHPGLYEGATLYDIKACYFHLLSRLPSLRVFLRRGERPIFLRWSKAEALRWQNVLAICGPQKVLRNALYGCALGRSAGSWSFHKGQRIWLPSLPGPFRAAALCVARAAWETCYLAAVEVDAVYSNTDCVIALAGLYPSCWERFGYLVNEVASGQADIHAPSVYRVGLRKTFWYSEGQLLRETVVRPERPSLLYHQALAA